jgi:sec-independent protein translocase protein TatC
MDAELDAIEGAEARLANARSDELGEEDSEDLDGGLDHADHPDTLPDPVAVKLRRVQTLRDLGDVSGARALLYEVLEQGDEDQRMVARTSWPSRRP